MPMHLCRSPAVVPAWGQWPRLIEVVDDIRHGNIQLYE